MRACVEVYEISFAEAEAEFVCINVCELKPRSNSATVTEKALEITLHPKDVQASGYSMPAHVAATLAFAWRLL